MNGFTEVRLQPDGNDLVIALVSDDPTIDPEVITIPANLISDFRDQVQQLFGF